MLLRNDLLAWGAWADVGKWASAVLLGVLVASGRLVPAVLISLFAVGARLGLMLTLTPSLGLRSVAVSTAVESSVTLLLLTILLRRELETRVRWVLVATAASVAGIGVSCALLA